MSYIHTCADNLVVYGDNSQSRHSNRQRCILSPGGSAVYQYFSGHSECHQILSTTNNKVHLDMALCTKKFLFISHHICRLYRLVHCTQLCLHLLIPYWALFCLPQLTFAFICLSIYPQTIESISSFQQASLISSPLLYPHLQSVHTHGHICWFAGVASLPGTHSCCKQSPLLLVFHLGLDHLSISPSPPTRCCRQT